MATATTTSSRAGSNEWGTKPQKESIPSNWLWVETFVKCLESIFEWWLCRCYSIHTWRFLIRARSWFVSVLISANRLTHTHTSDYVFLCVLILHFHLPLVSSGSIISTWLDSSSAKISENSKVNLNSRRSRKIFSPRNTCSQRSIHIETEF